VSVSEPAPSRAIRPRRLNPGFERFSGLYLWGLFIAVFGIWEPHLFLTRTTLYSVASEQAIAAMLGIAVLVPLAAGTYDLSIGATANLSAIIATWLQDSHHWNLWPAIATAVLTTAIIGAVNGFLVVRMHVNSFIATLGMATLVSAIQAIVSGQSQPLPPSSPAWQNLAQFQVGGFQIDVIYLLVLSAACWWALELTPAGRYLYAVGGNPEAARLAGINVGKWVWLSLVSSSTVCGVAGVLYASQNGPSLTFGSALLLPAFAAVFLGSTQIRPGRVNVWGTLLAVYILATGVKGMQLVTGAQWLNDMFNGIALIAAVAFAVWRQRKAVNARRSRPRQGRRAGQRGGEREDRNAAGLHGT
jgi:ribose transport system permease protein